jgi:hypothetical protein
MKFRRVFPGFVFLLVSLNCISQTDSLISRNKNSSDLTISYNSSLIYPGIRIGIEVPVYTVSLTRNVNPGKAKSILKDRYVSANMGWYHHPGFHDNLYFTAEWTMRRTYAKGFFTEFSSGPGYSRTFLGATTYHVDNSGNVNIIKSAGYNYALIIAGGGLGFDFSEKKRIPLLMFYKFDVLTMFPYNSTVYFRPAMELGLIYKPANFIRVFTKTRIVKK